MGALKRTAPALALGLALASIHNVKKSKRGRPTVDSEPVTVRVHSTMARALDVWRREQDDLPSRPEAIRRLVLRSH